MWSQFCPISVSVRPNTLIAHDVAFTCPHEVLYSSSSRNTKHVKCKPIRGSRGLCQNGLNVVQICVFMTDLVSMLQ